MRKSLLCAAHCAALCVAAVALWQSLTVHYNYGGNWTALYTAGSYFSYPPELASEHIFLFPGRGWDGQFYHLIAHDPLFRKGFDSYIDEPRLRHRRILAPAMAAALSLGRSEWIDPANVLVCWIAIFAGAWWLSRYAVLHAGSPYWGFLFVLFPATIISIDRLVVDGALAALAVAFGLFSEQNRPAALWIAMAAAALTRETGLLLLAGYLLFSVTRSNWRRAAVMSTAAAPCLAWYWFVQRHTRPFPYEISWVPGGAFVEVLRRPNAYAEYQTLFQAFDVISLLAVIASFLLALVYFRPPLTALGSAAIVFAVFGLLMQKPENWRHLLDYGRVYTPVLVFLALHGISKSARWAFLPALAVLPRLALHMAPQILHVLRSAI